MTTDPTPLDRASADAEWLLASAPSLQERAADAAETLRNQAAISADDARACAAAADMLSSAPEETLADWARGITGDPATCAAIAAAGDPSRVRGHLCTRIPLLLRAGARRIRQEPQSHLRLWSVVEDAREIARNADTTRLAREIALALLLHPETSAAEHRAAALAILGALSKGEAL